MGNILEYHIFISPDICLNKSDTNQNAKWVIILNDFEWYCVCPGDFQDMSGQQLGKGLVTQKDK